MICQGTTKAVIYIFTQAGFSADGYPRWGYSHTLPIRYVPPDVACSRRSAAVTGERVKLYTGKTEGGTGGASLPSFFFLREFFSRALLSERLEQATPNGVVILKLLI